MCKQQLDGLKVFRMLIFISFCLASCQTKSSGISVQGTSVIETPSLPTPSLYTLVPPSATHTVEPATLTPPVTPADPFVQYKTADALGTPLDSWGVKEVLPTIPPYATPTLMPSHSYFVIDLREDNPRSNLLVVLQYPAHRWEELAREDARKQGWEKSMLMHREFEGCYVSENFYSPPTWSSVEEEDFKPWEPFSDIRTFLGDDDDWLFKILRIAWGIKVRITYPSEEQEACHEEAMNVLLTNAFSYVDETPVP